MFTSMTARPCRAVGAGAAGAAMAAPLFVASPSQTKHNEPNQA